MTSVGSIDPRSAGDGGVPAGPDGSNSAPGSDAPPNAEAHADLLIGFLTDFHAAAREPLVPEPAKPAPTTGPLPSRFAAFVPDVDLADGASDPLAAAEPLPVWPPPPGAAAPTPPVEESAAKGSLLRRFGRRG